MNVQFDKVKLEVTREEAVELYYALKRDMLRAIETHWIHHKDAFQSHEAPRLRMLAELGRIVGHENMDTAMKEFTTAINATKATPTKSNTEV